MKLEERERERDTLENGNINFFTGGGNRKFLRKSVLTYEI
jgi:hypothetical protein